VSAFAMVLLCPSALMLFALCLQGPQAEAGEREVPPLRESNSFPLVSPAKLLPSFFLHQRFVESAQCVDFCCWCRASLIAATSPWSAPPSGLRLRPSHRADIRDLLHGHTDWSGSSRGCSGEAGVQRRDGCHRFQAL
jgi:hypothetical protein